MSERTLPDTGVKVRVMEYDMENFLVSCVERYKELTGVTSLRRVATPFLHEPTEPEFPELKGQDVDTTYPEAGKVPVPGGDQRREKGKADEQTVEP